MAAGIAHVFYDVYLGWSHRSLEALYVEKTGREKIPHGEVAVFLNASWTAVKVLAPGNVLLYYRSRTGAPITKEQLRSIPTILGAPRFGFAGNAEAKLLKAFETRFAQDLNRMRAVGA